MTEFNDTPADAPRIPVGTRVRYTQHEDAGFGKFYNADVDGTGTIDRDDGSLIFPYRVVLDNPGTAALGLPAPTVIADYNELEILS